MLCGAGHFNKQQRLMKKFAREIGATAYGFDAANAVEKVRLLVKEG